MTPPQIVQLLREQFGAKILAAFPEDKHPRVHVDVADWRPLAQFLRGSPALKFDVGATYIWVKDGSINKNGDPPSTSTYGLIKGNYSNDVVIVSGQVTYSF